jgi:hypothetical protein
VPLGNEAYKAMFPHAVWPANLAGAAPLAFGGNGQIVIHPDTHSGAGTADNFQVFTLHDLVAEGHMWLGGALTEHIAYFGEVTFSSDGTIDLEHLELHFNDLVPKVKHVLNLYVGRGFPNLTSFAPHSSYLADTLMPSLSTTALFGATSDSFTPLNENNLIEVNGMVMGRFIYGVGLASGANLDVRNTQDVYAHLGFKLGGMRLDGEGDTSGNPNKPWAENALTVDAFWYRSASHFQPMANAMLPAGTTPLPLDDTTYVFGTHLRGQLQSFELNAGFYHEWHDHATADGSSVRALTQYDELSYVVFPWLVPAVRFEWAQLKPANGGYVNDLKIVPGIAALIIPNLKLTLTAQIEWADGAPAGGWTAWGGSAAPTMGAITEIESIQLGLAYAF